MRKFKPNFKTKAEFVKFLEGTLIPDLKKELMPDTAHDFEEAVYWIKKEESKSRDRGFRNGLTDELLCAASDKYKLITAAEKDIDRIIKDAKEHAAEEIAGREEICYEQEPPAWYEQQLLEDLKRTSLEEFLKRQEEFEYVFKCSLCREKHKDPNCECCDIIPKAI